MDNLKAELNAILFVASAPVGVGKLIKLLKREREELEKALKEMQEFYKVENLGLSLLNSGDDWQLVSAPEFSELTEKFVKAEISGELTRPQLETLTVISYCGPITKPELEQLRGVNCALILRNLLMRGLIKENISGNKLLPGYEVTLEYLKQMGINNVEELPDYSALHEHEHIVNALKEAEEKD